MTEEEGGGLPDPSGSFGSSPPNRNNNGGNSSSSRSSSSSSSWKRSLGFSVMTLCLIQYWISFDYLMTSTTYYHDDSDVIYKMDLPTAQQQQQQHTTDDATHNHNHKIMNYYLNITTPLPLPTLVHYDPHFLGGYRNQHMRFVSFINHAVTNSIPQILLPSLRWGVAQGIHAGIDAPFEYLFDVIYWNERAGEMGLPRLVRYDVTVLEGSKRRNNTTTTTNNSDATIIIPTTPMIACFNTSSNLYSGLNEQLLRNPKTNIRKVNIWEEIGRLDGYSHCRQSSFPSIPSEQQQQQQQVNNDNDDDASDERFTYLIAHGGTKGAGRLWIEYYTMQRQRGKAVQTIHPITNRTITIHPEYHPVEKAINTILRPSEAIRNAIQSAILSSTAAATTAATMGDSAVRHDNNNKQQQQQRLPKFLALHPRIEHDMLIHRCSKLMEQNLTKIFNHLKTKELLSSSSSSSSSHFNLLFLAINAELVLVPMADYDDASKKLNQQHSLDHVGLIQLENSIVLNRTRMYGLFGNESSVGIPVFESGSRTAENILFPEEQHMDYYNTNSNNAAGNSTTIPPTPRLVSSESLGITSLVASIVNFFTIIEAESFVGVRGSSFSTDLFAVRYYMGKGGNYILSPEGIEELVGPPPSHSCG